MFLIRLEHKTFLHHVGTYKYYWKEVNLAFRLSLCFFEIHQNGEIWPPKLPIHKCWVSVVNQIGAIDFTFKVETSKCNSWLTSNDFFLQRRHFRLNPEAVPLLLPPIVMLIEQAKGTYR